MITPEEMMQIAELTARLVIANLEPKDDEMSLSQAYERYTRSYVDCLIASGRIQTKRSGTAKNCKVRVSRAAIEACDAQDRQAARLITERIRTRSTNK